MVAKYLSVDVVFGTTKKEFMEQIQPQRKPFVIKNLNIGPCKEKWNVEYLCKDAGMKAAVVHVSETPQMNFIKRNYKYQSMPFCDLVKRASEHTHKEYFLTPEEYYYFRSLGEDVRKEPSDISKQWPEFKDDIYLPDFFPKESFFSSIFRIASSGMQLWTHYDVLDNLLIQVNGRKQVILFPPSDALNLYLDGDKSSIIDVENPDLNQYPKYVNATKYKCILEPGDVLFIPALWFHNVIALEFGVAVNVFWKNLSEKVYDQKDPYGNKDLLPAARSMDILNRALKVLNELPNEYKDFYARKMVSKIENVAYLKM